MLTVNKYKDFTPWGFLMRHIQLLLRGSVGSHDIICSLHRRNAEFSARTYTRMFATLKNNIFNRREMVEQFHHFYQLIIPSFGSQNE